MRRSCLAPSIFARRSLFPKCSGVPFQLATGVPFHVAATTQQQGPARSVGARGGHEGPGGEPGPHPASASSLYAIRTRCRPPPRGRGRRRSRGRKKRDHRRCGKPQRARFPTARGGLWTPPLPWTQRTRPQELGKPQRARFPTAPTAIIFIFIKSSREDRCRSRAHRLLSRIDQISTTVDMKGRKPPEGEHPLRGGVAASMRPAL